MNLPHNRDMKVSTYDFERLVYAVRERPLTIISGFWMNIVEYRGYRFIQGDLSDNTVPERSLRHIGALVEKVNREDFNGFWPEVEGYPINEREEKLFINHIVQQGNNDVELIVPERNRQCPVAWGRFDESTEFDIYKQFIYPAVIEALKTFRTAHSGTLREEFPGSHNTSGTCTRENLLDMGCGCGDLIVSIQGGCDESEHPAEWNACDCNNLLEMNPCEIPALRCWGIDINPDNIEAAEEKGLHRVFLGDGEDVAEILPSDVIYDVIVFSGLLNRQVTSREKSVRIVSNAIDRLNIGGHIIVTGYTSCHFTAEDFISMGLKVRQKSIPENIFKDYQSYALRQLYVAQKI